MGSTLRLTAAHHEGTANEDASEQDHQPFTAGQQIIWLYKTSRHHRYRIAAEIVQTGRLRARIRSRTTEGRTILRWVKPSNLRRQEAGESLDLYPSRKS